ncbi:zinc finger protein CO3-like protein [Cinnamomum micranthum f. kanehirae]|uniref:Zinc finger protein CO3-like protein n=1 Tax=Cinnamomum micranthum f. kanehirae TaxID=337451 RepID=A0A3S3NJJ2_9MAGN|nr:zinc finger protein CO3-like protein [Cinnamomum micranthum f. kanehirae]
MTSSSDLFLFDGSFLCHTPEFTSSDIDLGFFSDPFSSFPDFSVDMHQTISYSNNPNQIQVSEPSPSLYTSTPIPLISSSSPPSQKLHCLSLNSITSVPSGGIQDMGVLDMMGVKTEFNADLESDHPSLFSDIEKARLMQRSLSSHSLDRTPNFLFQPHFSSLSESPKIENQLQNLAMKFEGSIRRASSTGDLHRINSVQANYGFSSPLAAHNSYVDEGSAVRVGRYSAEERKQRIQRYRSKRNLRNFNKTIKYACRKTLADSRPRVRGRFARNDDTEETNKATNSQREGFEEDLWVDGFNGEEEEVMAIRGFANEMSSQFQQFQYLGF